MGGETPKFTQKVKAGVLLPLNAYVRSSYYGQVTGGASDRTAKSTCCSGQHNHIIIYNDPAAWLGLGPITDRDGPYTRVPYTALWDGIDRNAMLLCSMADAAPDLDALTSLMEADKTVDMIKNAHKRARNLIGQASRGGMLTAKAAASAWLEWRYGWRVLGYDIAAIREAINQPRIVYREGQCGESDNGSGDTHLDYLYSSVDIDLDYHLDWSYNYRARTVAAFKVGTLNVLADPFTTAWEVVPFSFVADWFISLGDLLKAWWVYRNAEAVYCSLSTKEVFTSHSECTQSGTATHNSTGSASASERLERRTRSPVPPPQLVPSVRLKLTSANIADAAALLANRIPIHFK